MVTGGSRFSLFEDWGLRGLHLILNPHKNLAIIKQKCRMLQDLIFLCRRYFSSVIIKQGIRCIFISFVGLECAFQDFQDSSFCIWPCPLEILHILPFLHASIPTVNYVLWAKIALYFGIDLLTIKAVRPARSFLIYWCCKWLIGSATNPSKKENWEPGSFIMGQKSYCFSF